jgi:flavin reductase (DIM6/NTAB) family NADH-FMN oxidoreductase RutF
MPLHTGLFGPVPDGSDPEEYDRRRRRVLWSMPTGLFVVGSRSGDQRNLMTCNWVMQVATTPKLVTVAIEVGSVTHGLIEDGGGFSVSILARVDRALVRRFVKPAGDVVIDASGVVTAIQGEAVHEVADGLPVLASAVGWLACEVRQGVSLARASHTLFVGEVVDAGETSGAIGDKGGPIHPEVLRMEDTRMNYGG